MPFQRKVKRRQHYQEGIFCWCDCICLIECWACNGINLIAKPCPICNGEGLLFASDPGHVDLVIHRNVTEEQY